MFARLLALPALAICALLAGTTAAAESWLRPAAPASGQEAPLPDQAGKAPETPAAPLVEPRHPGAPGLYFFSPDWRPSDLGKLAVAIEDTLAAGAVPVSVSVQGFTRYEDFERQVALQPPVFVIAPDWIRSGEGSNLGLELAVVARPLRNGRTTYRKALMVRPALDSLDDLARGSIAATVHSMGDGSPDVVLKAFHLEAGSARVVPVPKDVDALLALSFGQVDAALVTSAQYELLARTRPEEAERLRVLAFSPEVGLPPFFASRDTDPALLASLLSLLARFPELPGGPAVLEMLGFDGFVLESARATAALSSVPAQPVPDASQTGGKDAATAATPPESAAGIAKKVPAAKKTDGAAPGGRR